MPSVWIKNEHHTFGGFLMSLIRENIFRSQKHDILIFFFSFTPRVKAINYMIHKKYLNGRPLLCQSIRRDNANRESYISQISLRLSHSCKTQLKAALAIRCQSRNSSILPNHLTQAVQASSEKNQSTTLTRVGARKNGKVKLSPCGKEVCR